MEKNQTVMHHLSALPFATDTLCQTSGQKHKAPGSGSQACMDKEVHLSLNVRMGVLTLGFKQFHLVETCTQSLRDAMQVQAGSGLEDVDAGGG